ncbi:MAG: hypothetical protein IJY42_02610, partial [Clostridia bacterium]|nr:hypothetical protein [Clostridia bacterium]
LGEDALVYTYFDTVIKGQVANSPEDYEMLQMTRDLAYYDFAFILEANAGIFTGFQKAVTDQYSVGTKMSDILANAEQNLTAIMEFYNQ